MDQQILEYLAVGRLRRDVQGLREAVARISAGDHVRVFVRSPRYGLYVVDGQVRIGAGGQPMVADIILGTSSEIQRIDEALPVRGGPPEPIADPAALEHGTVACVTFAAPTHGAFQVTGPLTGGQDPFLLVGSWIVLDGGLPAPRVVRMQNLDAEIHPANIPPRRTSMEEGGAASAGAAA